MAKEPPFPGFYEYGDNKNPLDMWLWTRDPSNTTKTTGSVPADFLDGSFSGGATIDYEYIILNNEAMKLRLTFTPSGTYTAPSNTTYITQYIGRSNLSLANPVILNNNFIPSISSSFSLPISSINISSQYIGMYFIDDDVISLNVSDTYASKFLFIIA